MYVTGAKYISFNKRSLKKCKQAKLPHLYNVFTHSTFISALQKGIKVILGIEIHIILISPKYFSHVIVINPKQKWAYLEFVR